MIDNSQGGGGLSIVIDPARQQPVSVSELNCPGFGFVE
jgi:hypothetical protein